MKSTSEIRAVDLAQRLGGVLVGDGQRVIRGVATLEDAGPTEITWVGSLDVLPRLAKSRACVALVPSGCSAPRDMTAIQVADPDLALCVVLDLLAPPLESVPVGIHPRACVDESADVNGAAIGPHVYLGPEARVGAGTILHHGVHVGREAFIGRDCVLWPNVVARERVRIGNRVVIHPNATIGADGFGYLLRDGKRRKIPQIGTVVIEDDVEIGANTTIDRARSGETRIGRGTKIDNLVQVGHNVKIGEDCIIVAATAIGGSATLGDRVVLSGQVGVTDHVRIGHDVHVAAKATVMKDIPDGTAVGGTPADEFHRYQRQQAAVRKLPELLNRVRDLEKRLAPLDDSRPT